MRVACNEIVEIESVIEICVTETESVTGLRGRKKTSKMSGWSAVASSLKRLGASATQRRSLRTVGRRKVGRRNGSGT